MTTQYLPRPHPVAGRAPARTLIRTLRAAFVRRLLGASTEARRPAAAPAPARRPLPSCQERHDDLA
ncbi:hypothetical protein ACFVTP_08600 [Streptomyces celluloflavus]|uniref:hypothetical protein n=1 Tax=Streptomyces celluloflavus TaxID=58344 RepID=UPI0036D7E6B1